MLSVKKCTIRTLKLSTQYHFALKIYWKWNCSQDIPSNRYTESFGGWESWLIHKKCVILISFYKLHIKFWYKLLNINLLIQTFWNMNYEFFFLSASFNFCRLSFSLYALILIRKLYFSLLSTYLTVQITKIYLIFPILFMISLVRSINIFYPIVP